MSLSHGDFFGYGYRAYAYPSYHYAYASQTGTTWYRANGDTVKLSNTRCDGDSNRWAKAMGSSWKDKGYEVVVYLRPETSSMTADGHIGLKHWGPHHTPPCEYKIDGNCCCWYDGGIRENGDIVMEIERPHPKNSTKMERW